MNYRISPQYDAGYDAGKLKGYKDGYDKGITEGKEAAKNRRKESDAVLVESCTDEVYRIIKQFREKNSMHSRDIAQLIVNSLANHIRSQP